MAKVKLRQKAIDDLKNIWDYTFEKWSEKQADTYYSTIKQASFGIGEHPDAGKEYHEISIGLRGLKAGRHVIFYRWISDESIEIVRILHERMDLKTRLSE